MIDYSSRFTLTDMQGTFPPNVLAGLKQVSGTDGPAREINGVAYNSPASASTTTQSSSISRPSSTAPPKRLARLHLPH